ncbi:helix-turn-helix transcriptional regulator [Lysobacter sp. F6437]|uniref:helix-turn-helix transcriptional regulator n=1 Tax=Lysobacter sp. F6437 TaxID=3459296 RepID=UPI00403DFC3C
MDDLDHKWDVQFRKGTLEMTILALLSHEPRYGLQILQKLHEFETMQITEGTLYPLLDRLKRDGLIDSYWVQEGDTRPRKYYRLSGPGTRKLDALSERWRRSVEDIQGLLEQSGISEQGEYRNGTK